MKGSSAHMKIWFVCFSLVLVQLQAGCSEDTGGAVYTTDDADGAVTTSDTSGSDTSGSDTSGTNTSGGDTSGADTSGADTSGADTDTSDACTANPCLNGGTCELGSAGEAVCTCASGFSGDTCADDVDECDLGTADCDANATCANTAGSFTCTCDENYVGDGKSCTSALDCALGEATCDVNATCTDTGAGSFCVCADGFDGDGLTCADLDECDLGTDNCDVNAACANIDGSFTCTCADGYVGDGVTCVLALDCALGEATCDANATCTDTGSGSFCFCNGGFGGDGQTCADTDGCAGSPCFAGVACVDVPAPGTGFTCAACPAGYTGDGVTCADTNGCAGDPCFAGVACSDVAAPGTGFTCAACPTGYTGDGVTCADTNGCAGDPCFAGVACSDVAAPGTGFTCAACPTGYTGDGQTCADTNGCAGDPCFAGVACSDVAAPGTGFTCAACPAGYSGDGQTCADIDGCAGNPCFAGVACADVAAPGTGFTCAACPAGYTGNGQACADIDECADNTDSCDPLVSCTNTTGGFTCGACPAGTDDVNGDGTQCDYFRTCYDLLVNIPTTTDGVYPIDPDGAGPNTPFDVFCDMTTDGGGWTRIAHLSAGSRSIGSIKIDAEFFASPWVQGDTTFTNEADNATVTLDGATFGMLDATSLMTGNNQMRFSCQDTTRSRTADVIWSLPDSARAAYLAATYAATPVTGSFSLNGNPRASVPVYTTHSEGTFYGSWHICGSAVSGTSGGFQLGVCHNGPTTGDFNLVDINQVALGYHVGFAGLRLECGADTPSNSSLIDGTWGAWVREVPTRATCYDHLQAGITADGAYPIDPDGPGGDAPFIAFCDMTRDGGGWTLIGKVAAGNYTALTDAEYRDLILNPTADVNPALLTSAAAPAAGQIAFYNQAHTNALYAASPFGNVRVDMSNNLNNPANNGTYYQAKVNPSANWDFWSAIRDSRMWGTGTTGSSVNGFGTEFILNFGNVYDAVTDTFPHGGAPNAFGWWSEFTHTLSDGSTFNTSRHFGLLCDGMGAGWQWLLTSDAADTRWKNDGASSQRTVIWLK
jgi:hypothetical protein